MISSDAEKLYQKGTPYFFDGEYIHRVMKSDGASAPVAKAWDKAWGEALVKKLNRDCLAQQKKFPIMGGASIPVGLIAPYEDQAMNNHSQTLSQLAERGGLDPTEALCVVKGVHWKDRKQFKDPESEWEAWVKEQM